MALAVTLGLSTRSMNNRDTGVDNQSQYANRYAAALDRLQAGASPDEVLQSISSIGDEDYRDGTLADVARFFAANGRLQDSLRFCQAIRDPLEHADALFAVGRELRKGGYLEPANDVFRQTIEAAKRLKRGDWEMPAIFLQVSDELWNLGQKEEARQLLCRAVELAKPQPQHFENAKTLAGCARLLSRWGSRPEAVDVARAIESEEQRNRVITELTKASSPPSLGAIGNPSRHGGPAIDRSNWFRARPGSMASWVLRKPFRCHRSIPARRFSSGITRSSSVLTQRRKLPERSSQGSSPNLLSLGIAGSDRDS
jgi:tetratricopeptide (TPR) repeat protein